MKRFISPGLIGLLLIIPLLLSCGSGGGSDSDNPQPPPGSKDPADIVASVRYQVANISYSQSASIIAKVFDYNGDRVIDGTRVRFTINQNNVTKTPFSGGSFRFSNGSTTFDTTTVNGFCTAVLSFVGVLTDPSAIVRVTVQPVGFNQVFENVDLVFFSNASVGFTLVLTTDKSTITGDGLSSTNIHVKIINAFGAPPQGPVEVNFSRNPNDVGSFNTTSVVTDNNGEATVTFTSSKVREAVSVIIMAEATVPVSGFSGGVSVSDIISVGLTPQVIGSITLARGTNTIFTYVTTEGPQETTITAQVFDVGGVPIVDNTVIKFSAVDQQIGQPLGLIPPFALTKDGVAEVIFQAGLKAGLAVVTATDSSGSISGSTFIEIRTDLKINPINAQDPNENNLASGIINRSYLFRLAPLVSGGVIPYTFSVISGSLPPGLTLTEAGDITGTPTETGTFTFTVQVEDAVGNTVSASFKIDINSSGLFIDPSSFTFTSGSASSQDLIAKIITSGGDVEDLTRTYEWNFEIYGVSPASAFTFAAGSGTRAVLAYDGTKIVTGGTIIVTVTSNGETATAIGAVQAAATP
jgi:hypothetical protein